MKDLLIEELRAADLFEIVDERSEADAILSGTAELLSDGSIRPNSIVSLRIVSRRARVLFSFTASTRDRNTAQHVVKKIRKQIKREK